MLLRGGSLDGFIGNGKSGIEPTEDSVVGLDDMVPGVSGMESSDTLGFCGELRKTGVGSWTREPSSMDGTRSGRGGRCGGDLPRGGW
jgi:hypothetical protein